MEDTNAADLTASSQVLSKDFQSWVSWDGLNQYDDDERHLSLQKLPIKLLEKCFSATWSAEAKLNTTSVNSLNKVCNFSFTNVIRPLHHKQSTSLKKPKSQLHMLLPRRLTLGSNDLCGGKPLKNKQKNHWKCHWGEGWKIGTTRAKTKKKKTASTKNNNSCHKLKLTHRGCDRHTH